MLLNSAPQWPHIIQPVPRTRKAEHVQHMFTNKTCIKEWKPSQWQFWHRVPWRWNLLPRSRHWGREWRWKENSVDAVKKRWFEKSRLCVVPLVGVPVVAVCVCWRLLDALVEFRDQETVVDVDGVAQVISLFLFLCEGGNANVMSYSFDFCTWRTLLDAFTLLSWSHFVFSRWCLEMLLWCFYNFLSMPFIF